MSRGKLETSRMAVRRADGCASGPGRLVSKHELWHDETNKMSVCPAKTQISLGICPVWSVFAVPLMGSYGPKLSSCGQRRLWSDWVDAQADLSLRWAHSHFVGFVMSRLNSCALRVTLKSHFTWFFQVLYFKSHKKLSTFECRLKVRCFTKVLQSVAKILWQYFVTLLKVLASSWQLASTSEGSQ